MENKILEIENLSSTQKEDRDTFQKKLKKIETEANKKILENSTETVQQWLDDEAEIDKKLKMIEARKQIMVKEARALTQRTKKLEFRSMSITNHEKQVKKYFSLKNRVENAKNQQKGGTKLKIGNNKNSRKIKRRKHNTRKLKIGKKLKTSIKYRRKKNDTRRKKIIVNTI